MKIGILTQPLMGNYGGIIQNYAMQRVLIDLGHHPVTIDFIPQESILTILKHNIKSILLGRRKYPFKRIKFKRDRSLECFINQHINVTNCLNSLKEFKCEDFDLDVVVVGSDQVWRPKYNPGYIHDMYLAFLKDYDCIKISYAASFGVDEWEYSESETVSCRKLLEQFKAVSVRESSAVGLVNRYLNRKDVHHVLDPTLLISLENYLTICKNINKTEFSYVGCYILDNNQSKQNIIESYSNYIGVPFKIFQDYTKNHVTIEEWLALFRDSALIITDSFHGTVFSIIFNKPFWVISNSTRGNTRIESLLAMFGLSERLIANYENTLDSYNIDWDKVNDKLNQYKEYSLNFIKDSLE